MSHKLELEIGTHRWTLHLWREYAKSGSCRVVILGSRAIVKLPPVRELCELAREEWHQIAEDVKARNPGVTEVIAGEH